MALSALLEERNVTRAGRRVGLSQPAMSAALARLRHHFDDDLLARAVHEEAPGIRLRFSRTPPTVVDDTATLLSATGGLLMPHGIISDFPATDLNDDRWVFLVFDNPPSVGDHLTVDDLSRLPWVTYQRTYDAPAVRQLGMLGIEPRVEVSVDSFQLLP